MLKLSINFNWNNAIGFSINLNLKLMAFASIADGIISGLPEILKFGVIGFSAVVFLLAYGLLRTQGQRQRPSSAMLKAVRGFCWMALVFAVLSAVVGIAEAFIISDKKNIVSSDEKKVSRTSKLIDIATDRVQWTMQEISLKHKFNDGVVSKNTGFSANPYRKPYEQTSSDSVWEDGPVYEPAEPVVPYMPAHTLSMNISEDEFEYRKLRQAIFRNIYYLDADREVLDSVLYRIGLRENLSVEVADRIKIGFPTILGEKLRWIMSGKVQEANVIRHSVGQGSAPAIYVELPKSVWILDNYPPDDVPRVQAVGTGMANSEAETIKRHLR